MPNPTIVAASLDDKELRESIDKLVAHVGSQTQEMKKGFDKTIQEMVQSLQSLGKVKIDLSNTFTGLEKAKEVLGKGKKGATGGSGGEGTTGKTNYEEGTIGALKEEIRLQGQVVDLQIRGTEQARQEVDAHRELQRQLKEETKSTTQRLQENAKMGLKNVFSLPVNDLSQAEKKLNALLRVQSNYKGKGIFSPDQWNRLQNEIDRTRKKIEQLTSKQPKSLKDVLGMDESSVDAIARKMRALKSVQINPKNAQDVKALSDAYQTLAKRQNEYLGKNRLIQESNKQLTSILNYVRNRIIYAFTVGSMMSFARDIIRVRAEYEMLDRSLGILVGDFEKGTAIFNELNQMALKSPFTLIELGTAAKQLTAYNFAANEVVDTTRRLADISAALGVPMERLTYNLGQIKAQGVLNARDARDFANAGLAIVPMLAKMYTEQKTFGDQMVTTAQVYDMMSKKMVTYQDVLKVLYQVTDEGGKFFDFQARQAETLKVQLANLTLAYNNMMNEIGASEQGLLKDGIQLTKKLFENWRTVADVIKYVVITYGTLKGAAIVSAIVSKSFYALGAAVGHVKDMLIALRTVVMTNPLGALATAVAGVLTYFLLFDEKVSDASQEVEMFGESAAKTVNKVKTLQKIIDGTDETSSTYKKTLSELSTIAHQYGIELDVEKARREEINKVTERTIELIKEESAERQRANQLTKAQEQYDTTADNARKNLRDQLKSAMVSTNIGGIGFKMESAELQENADAISDIIASIVESNISLIANKTGDEYEKGLDKLYGIIQQRMKAIGISEGTVSKEWVSSSLFRNKNLVQEYIDVIQDAKNAQDGYVDKINKNYNAAKKAAQATMDFTEKVNANAKALENNSNDALSLYNNIYDIVEIAKKNHVINFDLKLSAEKPPKWMMDMELPELQRLAARFTAIAQSGGHAQGYDREGTYEQGLRYAAAARRKQEEEERNARQKEKKTKTKKEDPILVALREEIKLVKDLQSAYDTLTKKSYSHADTMAKIQGLYGKTLNLLNNELSKHGLPLLDVSIVKGNNPNEVLAFFERLRDVLESKGMSNIKRMEVVEGVIKEFRVKADTYNLDVITKGLNNELGKLKEEYELAVELDANPEMGNMFADMFGIDTTQFPKTIDEYMDAVQQKFEDAVDERGLMGYLGRTNNVFKASEEDWKLWAEQVGLSEEGLKNFNGKFIEAQGVARKWAQDTVKSIRDLEYKLGDINKKIEIENTKLKVLEEQAANETNVNLKHLLELRIQEQKEAIEKLKMESIQLLPFYEELFGDMYNVSVRRLKDIANAAKEVMRPQKDGQGEGYVQRKNEKGKTVYDIFAKDREGNIKKTTVSLQEFIKIIKQIDSVQQKIAESSPWEKIKDSFSKDANGKIKNIASGIEGISGELSKMGQLTGVATEIFSSFSNPNEYNETAEVMGDIGTTMEGLATAGQGFAKMYSGDIIGGATDMVKGFYSAISTWFDNDDKRILQQIKDSEREVQKLEITVESLKGTYDAMTDSAEHSYGAQSEAATLAASSIQEQEMALKRLQLAETKRQLQLEKSRDSKKRDEDKIISLRKDIVSQQNEIDSMLRETNRAVEEVVDSLLGISRGSWAEELTDALISALRNGENYMKTFEESWEEMVQNMVVKTIAARVIGDALEKNVLSRIEQIEKEETDPYRESQANIAKHKANLQNLRLENEKEWLATISQYQEFPEVLSKLGEDAISYFTDEDKVANRTLAQMFGGKDQFLEKYGDQLEQELFKIYDNYNAGIEGTLKDAQQTAQERALKEVLAGDSGKLTMEELKKSISFLPDLLKEYSYPTKQKLNALQQGISGITEQQAGVLESYWNANTQQQYVQSNLLTQIRDAVVAMNGDIQLSVQGQILLQLQQSYQVQMSIESILQGVLVPSGQGIRVELMS